MVCWGIVLAVLVGVVRTDTQNMSYDTISTIPTMGSQNLHILGYFDPYIGRA